eukprot:TRINITY_DN66558_c10_g1_i1.p1 TRINITY_DN66558_c10_g1~~TRINITY_DN66558_c10_g1_i1.p1  ORF type:complete len:289 (-),score=-6.38 TRINITY_DN66558_c10_g1_i1:97-963(-)
MVSLGGYSFPNRLIRSNSNDLTFSNDSQVDNNEENLTTAGRIRSNSLTMIPTIFDNFMKFPLWNENNNKNKDENNNDLDEILNIRIPNRHRDSISIKIDDKNKANNNKNKNNKDDDNNSLISPHSITELSSSNNTPINKKVNKKKLRFNKNVKVILIPTRNEYNDAGLSNSIWWNLNDYNEMKFDAAKDIITIIKSEKVDAKTAMNILYGCKSIQNDINNKHNNNKDINNDKDIDGDNIEDIESCCMRISDVTLSETPPITPPSSLYNSQHQTDNNIYTTLIPNGDNL